MSSSTQKVKLDVGGTIFETTLSTLTKQDNMFFPLLARYHRLPNQETQEISLFIDRSPTYFSKILDYLRDGENGVTIPDEPGAREALRKEAEFYGLHDLAKMCDD